MATPTDAGYYNDPLVRPKLDPKYYILQREDLTFYRKQTGIEDEDELRSHIMRVQAKAYEIYGYPCIRSFAFLKFKISTIEPGYSKALHLLRERKNPIFLDIGCCFGNDTRKAVLDGWPVENVIASDLYEGFWDCGHELFKSIPETFPVAFVAGDAFDNSMIKLRDPFITEEDIANVSSTATPSLKDLTSLTPLQGKISAIHASSLFHLFSEEKQYELARRLASLLSPEKGSVIFGQHGAQPTKGYHTIALPKSGEDGKKATAGVQMFCHTAESWKEMWEDVFGDKDGKGSERIEVDARLFEVDLKNLIPIMDTKEDTRFWGINWCITRQ